MWHVRLGDDQDLGRHGIQDGPPQLDHGVRLREVDARGSDRLPEKGDGVHADDLGALGDVVQHGVGHFQEQLGVGVVEVNLVGAEGRPHVARAAGRLDRCQQRQSPRPYHLREVDAGLDGDEVVIVGRLAPPEGFEPGAMPRDVVGNHMVKAIRRLKARSKSRGLRYEAEKEAHANTRAQLAEAESRAVAYFNDMQTSDHLLAEAREVLESYRIVPDLDQYENQVVSCGYCGHIFQSGEWEDHSQRLYQSSEWSERHCPLAAVLGGGLPESQSVTESVTKGEDNDA